MRKCQKGFSAIELILVAAILVTATMAIPNAVGARVSTVEGLPSAALSLDASQREYVSRLLAMEGTPYLRAPCSTFICQAKRHPRCSAAEMWLGCAGELTIEQEAVSFASVNASELQPGDVVSFHGVHLAVYVGGGVWMDSIPERGVGRLTTPPNPMDLWYSGRVKILRWRNK
jgi:hypothetical protein